MGYELARAAAAAGHKVTLVTGPSCLPAPAGIRVVDVETSAEMFAAVREHFDSCDCLVMAAAVSDYTPVRAARVKMKKSSKAITLKLKPTPDILKWAASRRKRKQVVIGFALEDKNIRANAERKMRDKNLDMIIANTPSAIGSQRCEVFVKMAGKDWMKITRAPKRKVARRLIRMIEQSAAVD
jgi:phosphopantothenoylcysteine decarboxylase/phosphopantothenate--cysteine ligase